ncbi:hypothetical protein DSECCO2_442100 [anaerobic digester metagenome]
MHDHEVGPVGAAGLVQEHDLRQGDVAELFGKQAPYESHIRRKGRADVIGLQEGYLPDSGPAGAGAPDEGDVALVAPVENFLYCRFAYHVRNSWSRRALSEPIIQIRFPRGEGSTL